MGATNFFAPNTTKKSKAEEAKEYLEGTTAFAKTAGITPTGKKVNPKTVGSELEQIQQKRIEAERLKAEKKLMEDTLKSVLNQEFVQDDNADILRAENVELASAEWVNKTYLSNSYMIPYNDTKMMDMSSIIAIAVSMCGKKLVSRNAIITTMAIETGKSYIYKDGKPLDYSTTSSLSGFASVRPSGVPGKVSSASGYCQVIRTTGVPYLKIYASEKKKTGKEPTTGIGGLIASLGITNAEYKAYINDPENATIGKLDKLNSYCAFIKRYPIVGIGLSVAYFADLARKVCPTAKKSSDISTAQWLEVIRKYYGFPFNGEVLSADGGYKSNIQRDKYAANYVNTAFKLFGDSNTSLSEVVGEKILGNNTLTTIEQIFSASKQEAKENAINTKESLAVGGGGLSTDDLNDMYYDKNGNFATEAVIPEDYFSTKISDDAFLSYENILKSMKNKKIDITGVIGMPPRFSRYADCRMGYVADNDKVTSIDRTRNIYGRVYTENFIKMANLVALTPGVPDFMLGFGDGDKKTVLTNLITLDYAERNQNENAETIDVATDKIKQTTNVGKKGKTIFGFKEAWADYAEHARRLVIVAANMMNITDDDLVNILDENECAALGIVNGQKPTSALIADMYNESKYAMSSTLSQFYNTGAAITDSSSKEDNSGIHSQNLTYSNTILYNSGPIDSSESISNSVKSSFLENMINTPATEMMKDMSFLLNAPIRTGESLQVFKDKTSGISSVVNFALGTIGLNGVGGALSKMVTNIKIPKVFGDSSYSKQYNIKVKLSSPSADRMARFKYVLMPLMRLLPYCVPRQYGFYPDAIISPFLVQIYAKGLIACELGMVTAMQIERNVETAGLDGIPTELDVTFTVTELNPFLSIPFNPLSSTASYDGYLMSGAVSFLSTLTGVPMYRGDAASVWNQKAKWGRALIGQMMSSPNAYAHTLSANIGQKYAYRGFALTNFSPFNSTR